MVFPPPLFCKMGGGVEERQGASAVNLGEGLYISADVATHV